MIELQAAGDVVFVLESGVLDQRATLAFVGGQCHGLAMALRARTGYPLAAVFDPAGSCVHVCVRDPDGRLIDITGAHREADIVGDGERSVRDVSTSFIDALTVEHGWAAADSAAADAWVDPVLERVSRDERLAPLVPAPGNTFAVVEGVVITAANFGGSGDGASQDHRGRGA